MEAVLCHYRAGIPWRDLPERFGAWKNVHRRFSRWAASGVWEQVFMALSADADNEYAMIDATVVPRAPAQRGDGEKGGGDEARGRSKGGLSTKIRATVDALGNPTGFTLTARQVAELDEADELVLQIAAPTLIEDKGHDAEARVLAPLRAAGKIVVILPRRHRNDQREYDRGLYQAQLPGRYPPGRVDHPP